MAFKLFFLLLRITHLDQNSSPNTTFILSLTHPPLHTHQGVKVRNHLQESEQVVSAGLVQLGHHRRQLTDVLMDWPWLSWIYGWEHSQQHGITYSNQHWINTAHFHYENYHGSHNLCQNATYVHTKKFNKNNNKKLDEQNLQLRNKLDCCGNVHDISHAKWVRVDSLSEPFSWSTIGASSQTVMARFHS